MSTDVGTIEGSPVKETEPKSLIFAQHIYTRVATRNSPEGFDGWQTYRYTRTGEAALNNNDVLAIDRYVQHQRSFASPTESSRWQFFPLGNNRAVFTRVVPRKETDRSGSSYLYLAHSLVIPTSDLQKLPNGVLSLWSDSLFSGDSYRLDEEDYKIPSPNLEPLSVSARDMEQVVAGIPAGLENLVKDLSVDQLAEELVRREAAPLANLILAMKNAEVIKKNMNVIAICGNQNEIDQVLKFALQFAHNTPYMDEAGLSFTS